MKCIYCGKSPNSKDKIEYLINIHSEMDTNTFRDYLEKDLNIKWSWYLLMRNCHKYFPNEMEGKSFKELKQMLIDRRDKGELVD